jgi:hypothetical protein
MTTKHPEPEIPDVPGWDDDLVREELAFQREFDKQGRLEEQRLQNRWLDRDPDDDCGASLLGFADEMFSLDDGRLGLDPDTAPLGSSWWLYRGLLAVVLLAMLLGLPPLLRACAADRHAASAGQPASATAQP